MGKTIRERAQELIDIAHPDDRDKLVKQAKEAKVLYPDQIYFPESGHFYPAGLCFSHKFKNGLKVNFRPIKPSDEEKCATCSTVFRIKPFTPVISLP